MERYKIQGLRLLLLTGIVFLMVPSAASAEEKVFEASVDRDIVSPGHGLQLKLTFQGTVNIPPPELRGLDGFRVRYNGPSTMMSIVNGRVSSSKTHIYTLIPLKIGTFKIGPFSFEYQGDTYTSNELTVEVVKNGAGTRRTERRRPGQSDIGDGIFLVMKAGKKSVYLNEIVPLTITLYINGLAVRDVRYPVFEHEGFAIGEFDQPKQYRKSIDGIIYDVIEFRTQIFGTRPGEFKPGPARIKCNLVSRRRPSSLFDDFFGGFDTEPLDLKSDPISVNVLPLPKEGRPRDFNGAVGAFDLSVEASPTRVKEGDPVTLKMTIRGNGNFSTVTAPQLKRRRNLKVYDPRVEQKSGAKIFEQVIIPDGSVKKIPGITFSYFDPSAGVYKTITKGNIPIQVTKPEKKEELTIIDPSGVAKNALKKERLGRDIIFIKDSPGELRKKGLRLYNNVAFLLLHTVPLMLIFSALIIKRRNERLGSDIGYARRRSAFGRAKKGVKEARRRLDGASPQEFYDYVFRTLRAYIGDRFNLPEGGLTAGPVNDALRGKGVEEDCLTGINEIFEECDMARYAPSELGKLGMEKTFRKLMDVLNTLERRKP